MNPHGVAIAYYTLVRKEVVRMTRIWTQTLLPSVITMSLYYAVFGTLIGSQIAPTDGFSYIQFIVPGLVMMSIITNAYSNVVSAFFGAKFQHNLEELMVSPTPAWIVVAGFASGGVIRGLAVGVLVLLTSLFFTHLIIYNLLIVILAAILTCVLFSLAGLLNGMFAKTFDAVQIVPIFVLTPLTYLGGVFYSVSRLPPFWRGLSYFNPILYMVNVFRYGFLGVSDVPLAASFALLIGLTVILLVLTTVLFQKGVGMKS
jgi:ABC-2 type transport system permease protein